MRARVCVCGVQCVCVYVRVCRHACVRVVYCLCILCECLAVCCVRDSVRLT